MPKIIIYKKMNSNSDISFNEETESDKDNLIIEILNHIKENKNFTIKCKIIKENKEKSLIFMTINIHNIDYLQFIRINDNIILENKDIQFQLKDIKLTLKNNKYFFLIENYEILKHKIYELKNADIYNTITEIKDSENFTTIKLKAREIFDTLKSTKFNFYDINGNLINIKNNEGYEFENGKIYLFNGYFYNKSKKRLVKTMISSIKEYLNNKSELISFKDIENYENLKLLNFKCKVKSYSLIDKYIKITDIDSDEKIYKVNLNINLLKKISLNGLCYFFNFRKKNESELEMTNFSDIEIKEETIIEFIFDDFDINKNYYYNRIKIDKKHYNIDNKIINIRIEDDMKNNIFIQDIIYERVENKKSIFTYEFSLEVDRGKTNHFHSLLAANGNHSYQFYFQAKFKEDLPKSISLNINNKKYEFDKLDNFKNNLIERFTIINIPKQDINKSLSLQIKEIQDVFNEKKIHDWKYLISINDKHEKDYKIFIKEKDKRKKKYLQINEKDFKIIKNIFNKNTNMLDSIKPIKYEEIIKILSPFLKNKEAKEIKKILNVVVKGFRKYKFQNKRRDYETIKYLSFIFLCVNALKLMKNNTNIFDYFKNFRDILCSLINFEYIDRIKVILGFISIFIDNIKSKKIDILNKETLVLFDLDNEENISKYPWIKRSYNTLYEIIDKMKEGYPLHQGIFSLNSLIYKELVTSNNFHSGALLNEDDIKLELFKNVNRFLFLSFKDDYNSDDYAEYSIESKTTKIFVYSIFGGQIDKKKYNRASSVVLILFFNKIFAIKKKI